MALRKPLKRLPNGDLKSMNAAEIALIVDEAIRQYGNSPSVVLNIDQGNGTLTTLVDYYMIAGPLATSSGPEPTADAASYQSVNYANVRDQSNGEYTDYLNNNFGGTNPKRGPTIYSNYSFPVYMTASGNIQSMNATDFVDTFITPAIVKLIESTTTSSQAGTYFISTSTSEAGATLVNAAPVFQDSVADVNAFNLGNLPEVQDQSFIANNFYLHRVDPVASVGYAKPACLKINTNDVQDTPATALGEMLQDWIQWAAITHTGSRIRYQLYPSTDTSYGVARGSGITNSYVAAYTTKFEQPDATTYYAQNVPTGSPTVQSTHFLRIGAV